MISQPCSVKRPLCSAHLTVPIFNFAFDNDIHEIDSWKKLLSEKNEPQKSQNLKKMLRKPPGSNAWATTFKNADSS